MEIHDHPNSTFSRRVRIVAHEKGLSPNYVFVDMAKRAHRGEAHLALNPYGKVPVLKDGDLVIYESTAVMEYLEAKFPEPSLLPDTPEDRARVAMYVKCCDLYMAPHVGAIIFPRRFFPKDRWDLEAQGAAQKAIEKHLAVIERDLEGKSFLVAERFTLADVVYIPFLHFLELMEISPGPNTAAWAKHLLARPSAEATVPAQ